MSQTELVLKEQENNNLAVITSDVPETSSFADARNFEHAQRVAKMLSSSNLIPKEYQGNIQNTMIALEMANRIGASPLMVMQNLYIIQGRPSWSSTFIIAALNASKRFSPLRFETGGEGDEYGCYAWAYDTANNDKLNGPKITYAMAKAEGWYNKPGSKWKTMPELMLRYRAAAFFGRLYAPDIMMGMQTAEEIHDVEQPQQTPELLSAIEQLKTCKTKEDFEMVQSSFPDLEGDKEFQKNLVYYLRKNKI